MEIDERMVTDGHAYHVVGTPAVVAMLEDIQASKPLMDSMEHVADSERELLGRIFPSAVGFCRGIRLRQIRDRFLDRFRYGTELPMFNAVSSGPESDFGSCG